MKVNPHVLECFSSVVCLLPLLVAIAHTNELHTHHEIVKESLKQNVVKSKRKQR